MVSWTVRKQRFLKILILETYKMPGTEILWVRVRNYIHIILIYFHLELMSTGPATPGREQRKKERFSMHKLSKGCHQGQNVTVLTILKRLQYFLVFHGSSC